MARYKYIDTNPQFLSVDLARQLLPGTFEHALNHLLDHEVDLAHFDARFRKPQFASSRMVVIAIEQNAPRCERLRDFLEPFAAIEPDMVQVLQGDVSSHVEAIAKFVSSAPTLYFLDPFGPTGLDASQYPTMLAGPGNEIFALFSDVGMARLRGVIHAKDSDIEQQLADLREQPGLFPELVRRFIRRLLEAGAKYVQAIPMRGATGAHKHLLVYASKSQVGWTAMKEAISDGLNRSDLSEEMRNRMKDDLRVPAATCVRHLQTRYAGSSVRWSSKDRKAQSAKATLLQETPVLNFQCPEIKEVARTSDRHSPT